jgi:outer membrane protein insertion porin family
LGFVALLLSLLSGMALRAQNPPAEQKPPSSPSAQSSTEKTPATPSEKGKEPKTEGTQQLRLDNPEPGAPPPSQLTPQTQQNPQAKPSQTPPAAPPQKLQLETPKEAPAPQKAPELTTPVAPSQPQGQPAAQATIQSIIFRGNRRIPAATLRARIFSHQGDVYNENILERDFMALWNTGFFDDIRLEVVDSEKGGKIVTFFVREKKLVRSIDYKGLSSVQQSDVLDEFKKRKVGLSIQSQYDPVTIKRAEVVLQEMLAAHGKMFATVRHRTRNIPPNSVALTFIVVEGPKVNVGNVRFKGNQVFTSNELTRAMKYSRAAGLPPWFYWFHKTYDKEKIEADLENIRDLYRDHGYFYALAKEPDTKMVDTRRRYPFFFFSWGRGKRVDLTIPVEEGLQYRLGRFVIRGNKLFTQQQLAPILRLKPGDLFALSKVRKAIENYTKLYGQFGYINFTASPDIEPDNKRRVINLALDFEEEKQFIVHRIEFSGNTKTRDKVIRRELLLSEGDMFNSSFWDLSVLRVNQLGFFDTVKKEDYEITQDAKNSTVDITLKVKEKGKNSIGFSGGVSGLAGNFVGINYATNNFLGLGETLSVQTEWGTYQKMYSFGFTEPYVFDRAMTVGFTVYHSNYRYDQLRQLAAAYGVSPSQLQTSSYQYYAQNFQQNSSGFTAFSSYPLRRTFARLGFTYSYSYSSMQAFNAASESYFEAINFRGLAGPSALSGIVSSSIMPTYLYNTINDAWNPTRGKYFSIALMISGLGGNVYTATPSFEFKYFHPVRNKRSEKPQAFGMHILASTIQGYGGRVPPPFSRFYIGGEYDIRGFDIRSISPLAFFPATGQVCNRDNFGNPILATGANGQKGTTCGSYTQFPYYTPIYPGGDTEIITNFEYRVPIAGPVTMAAFLDAGSAFVLRTNQLQIDTSIPSLQALSTEYPYFTLPTRLKIISATNLRPRSSTGIDLQVILPIVNAPFHLYYGYNWLREDNVSVVPPQVLPPQTMFPNLATYEDAVGLFRGFLLKERKGRVGFTVARTF